METTSGNTDRERDGAFAPAGPDEKEGASADPGHAQPNTAEVESARLLENEVADELEGEGISRDELRRLADAYVAEARSGDRDDFIAWVRGRSAQEPRS
jgi:hypothetical protein